MTTTPPELTVLFPGGKQQGVRAISVLGNIASGASGAVIDVTGWSMLVPPSGHVVGRMWHAESQSWSYMAIPKADADEVAT